MVVVKRPLEHFDSYGYRNSGNTLIESSRVSGHILQGRNMNSMNGILFQLSSLALTASEMFNSLSGSAHETFDRINALNTRIQQINNKLPEYEQFMHENNSKLLFSASGYELTEANFAVLYKKDHQNISKQNNPVPLSWQYTNNCRPSPEFSPLLDQIHNTVAPVAPGEEASATNLPKYKTCSEAYTDSNFFFNEWAKRELQRLKKAKQKRKEERKKQRMEQAKLRTEKKQVKQMKIHRKKYNSEGQIINDDSAGKGMSRAPSTKNMDIQATSDEYSNNSGGNNSYGSSNNNMMEVKQPPVFTQSTGVSPNNMSVPPPPPISNGGYGVPPPPVNNNGGYSVPPPPPINNNGGGYGVPPPPVNNNGGYGVPPPPVNVGSGGGYGVPPPPVNNNGGGFGVPPPPSRTVNVPPPPSNNIVVSPPPQSSSGGGEGNFDLLKSVESSKAQMNRIAVTGRGNLLDDIKGGTKLRPAAERKLVAPKEEEKVMSVADILSKKFEKVGGDSDEEESDSDFSDSDDW